jgi:hypothetical protein
MVLVAELHNLINRAEDTFNARELADLAIELTAWQQLIECAAWDATLAAEARHG